MSEFAGMKFEAQACICGERSGVPVHEARDWNFGSTEVCAEAVRCSSCGSIYPDRFPDEDSLSSAYARYYTFRPRALGLKARIADAVRRRYLDREAPDTGDVLDYGCGSGAYLARLAKTRPATRRFGTDLFRSNSAHGFTWVDRSARRQFRHITLGHVLEHVRDPAKLIAELAERLEPGGTLWVATPNAKSFLFDAFGPYARDTDFPRHRVVLSKSALAEIASRAGLRVTWRRPPLLNAVLNAKSCARNVVRHGTSSRVRVLVRAAAVCAAGVFRPERQPELVALFSRAA